MSTATMPRIDPGAMRHTLGRFTTGVTVVTTARGDAGRPLRDPGDLFEWSGDVPFVRGAIAHVGCSLHAEHEAGDHTLYLGRVEHLQSRPGEPLLFHRGTFGRVSPEEQVLAHSWGW